MESKQSCTIYHNLSDKAFEEITLIRKISKHEQPDSDKNSHALQNKLTTIPIGIVAQQVNTINTKSIKISIFKRNTE